MELLSVYKHDFRRILYYLTKAGLIIDRKYVFTTEQLVIFVNCTWRVILPQVLREILAQWVDHFYHLSRCLKCLGVISQPFDPLANSNIPERGA